MTHPTTPIITEKEAKRIQAARRDLKTIEERLRGWEPPADVNREVWDRIEMSRGRSAEAADAAEGALFNLLNLLANHIGDPLAKEAAVFVPARRAKKVKP